MGGGLQDFSVSPRPLGFGFLGFGFRGLGPGLDKTVPRRMFLISMDSYHKILLVFGTIVRLEGCC